MATMSSEYNRDYYKRTKADKYDRKYSLQKERLNILRGKLWDYLKDKKCIDCGESDPVVLEFDHRDGSTKIATVSILVGRGASWENIELEINKCDIRCANCHRRKTSVQLGWHKSKIK